MIKVKVLKDMKIELPLELKGFVLEGDEFVVSILEDSIRLKKIKSPDLLDLASTVEDKESPSMEEISRIVHDIRGIDET